MRGKPKDDENYSAEETAKRLEATVRAMIATPPRPRSSPTPKAKARPASKGRVRKGKLRA
jgi:hypothetical protein